MAHKHQLFWICSSTNQPLILVFSVILRPNSGQKKFIWSRWGCFVANWAPEASENVLYPLHLHCLTSKVRGSRKTTWAAGPPQDNTGKLPCQVLEKKLRHILERNLETFRLFLLTSPWKPLRMFYSHFILVASPHKSEDEGRQPHQDFRTPPSHLWDITANLQAVPIFRT